MVNKMSSGLKSRIEIEGVVKVYDRDKSGNVLQLFLETDNFEKYILEQGSLEEELHELINIRFRISGIVNSFGSNSYKIISVDQYQKVIEQSLY